jgi:selenocysteine lyase/cysteine desulfurase
MDPIWARIRELANGLRARLAKLKGVTLTDLGQVKGGIVTFAVDGQDHVELKQKLHQRKINTTVSTQFSSRLDLKGRGLKNVMRSSVHIYNTEDELDCFVAALDAAR